MKNQSVMSSRIIQYGIRLIGVFLFQVLILNNIQFSGYINPYFYIWFILILPLETPGWLMLILAGLLGMGIDLFPQGISGDYPTLGIHTSATLLIAFLRHIVLRWISPRDDYDPNTSPVPGQYGWFWFVRYLVLMVGFHHLMLFILEDFSLIHLHRTLFRVLFSAVVTIVVIVLWEAIRSLIRKSAR